MNRNQKIALALVAANLLLILLFPPYDQYSIASSRLPVFAGFNFVFTAPPHSEINSAVQALEAMVVVINAGIAWLLLRDNLPARRAFGLQNATLAFTSFNLVLMILFPPFESVFALTNATIPTFEGFYFIFSQKPSHVIVTALLYIEVVFVLVNGAVFWLIFKPNTRQELAAQQMHALADAMRKKK